MCTCMNVFPPIVPVDGMPCMSIMGQQREQACSLAMVAQYCEPSPPLSLPLLFLSLSPSLSLSLFLSLSLPLPPSISPCLWMHVYILEYTHPFAFAHQPTIGIDFFSKTVYLEDKTVRQSSVFHSLSPFSYCQATIGIDFLSKTMYLEDRTVRCTRTHTHPGYADSSGIAYCGWMSMSIKAA